MTTPTVFTHDVTTVGLTTTGDLAIGGTGSIGSATMTGSFGDLTAGGTLSIDGTGSIGGAGGGINATFDNLTTAGGELSIDGLTGTIGSAAITGSFGPFTAVGGALSIDGTGDIGIDGSRTIDGYFKNLDATSLVIPGFATETVAYASPLITKAGTSGTFTLMITSTTAGGSTAIINIAKADANTAAFNSVVLVSDMSSNILSVAWAASAKPSIVQASLTQDFSVTVIGFAGA